MPTYQFDVFLKHDRKDRFTGILDHKANRIYERDRVRGHIDDSKTVEGFVRFAGDFHIICNHPEYGEDFWISLDSFQIASLEVIGMA